MRNVSISLLIMPLLLVSLSGVLHAQNDGEQVCIVTLIGQNRNRTVAGAVNTECDERNPVQWHDPPWGNWGVSSNYGKKDDTDQFRGWKWKDGPSTKKQWNSCTTNREKFRARNCAYYNASNCTKQASSSVVVHGQMQYRRSSRPCPKHRSVPTDGCKYAGVQPVSQSPNYMTLYELDSPDSDDLVETLYFPGTSLTLTGCTHSGCPEKTTNWLSMTSSTSAATDVRAQLRMKAKARLDSFCDWDWN